MSKNSNVYTEEMNENKKQNCVQKKIRKKIKMYKLHMKTVVVVVLCVCE